MTPKIELSADEILFILRSTAKDLAESVNHLSSQSDVRAVVRAIHRNARRFYMLAQNYSALKAPKPVKRRKVRRKK